MNLKMLKEIHPKQVFLKDLQEVTETLWQKTRGTSGEAQNRQQILAVNYLLTSVLQGTTIQEDFRK